MTPTHAAMHDEAGAMRPEVRTDKHDKHERPRMQVRSHAVPSEWQRSLRGKPGTAAARSLKPGPTAPQSGGQNWASLNLVKLPEDKGDGGRAWDWHELNDTLYRT